MDIDYYESYCEWISEILNKNMFLLRRKRRKDLQKTFHFICSDGVFYFKDVKNFLEMFFLRDSGYLTHKQPDGLRLTLRQ